MWLSTAPSRGGTGTLIALAVDNPAGLTMSEKVL
jgi:hypothetical protein